MTSRAALAACVAAALLSLLPPPAAAQRGKAGKVTCYSVHETFDVGEVFSDENCRRVKCIAVRGQGYVTEVERCPLPDIPPGAKCTMTEKTADPFPLCCPKAVCDEL